MLSMNAIPENMSRIGRWILVLPAAIGALVLSGIIVNTIFSLQQWFIGAGPDSGFGKITFWIVSAGISSASFVYYGSRTAPAYRKIVSMCLAALIVGMMAIGVFLYLTQGTDNLVWKLLSAVASVFGAGAVVYGYFENGEDYQLLD